MTTLPAPSAPSAQRETYLDLLRAIALVRVVAYHTYGFAWFSILFPSMGVMFALAGSLTARSLQRSSATCVLRNRVRRLLPSLWLLGAVLVPLMLWHGWPAMTGPHPAHWFRLVYWIVPVLDPPGSAWGGDASDVLWYVRAYLWFVVLSPAMWHCFRRWPTATIVAPIVLVGAYSFGVVHLEGLGAAGSGILDFATYGACWILGFAHRTGSLRRLPMTSTLGLASAAMLLGAAWALLHPDPASGYDLNEIPLAQALWSIGAVLILMRWRPALSWLPRTPVLGTTVAVLNARALTIYLWHNIAIDVSVPINDRLGLYTSTEQFATTWALTGVAVLLFGWVEDIAARRRPRLLPGMRSIARSPARGTGAASSRGTVGETGTLRSERQDEHRPATDPSRRDQPSPMDARGAFGE